MSSVDYQNDDFSFWRTWGWRMYEGMFLLLHSSSLVPIDKHQAAWDENVKFIFSKKLP